MTAGKLSAASHIGGVRLQVSDVGRSVAFYCDLLGFREVRPRAGEATLGVPAGPWPLVTLVERPSARPVPPRGRLGLFHFAILLPHRASLGSVLGHLRAHDVPLGMSDHLVSEALYLADPDGLGIEIYSDRPQSSWNWRAGEIAMATAPLDVDGLLREPGVTRWHGMPAGTTIGHMHLHVGDLANAERFYAGAIGLDVTVRRYPGALFMSAGGYHHHLGTNTWARGAAAPDPDEAQLLHWDLVVSGAAEVHAIGERIRTVGGVTTAEGPDALIARDPFGTAVRIVSRS